MCALISGPTAYVLVEDPSAPHRFEFLQAKAQAEAQAQQESSQNGGNVVRPQLIEPSHYCNTFLSVSPPGALDQLLGQLRARWTPARQPASTNNRNPNQPGSQLVIEGHIFKIGTDWIVRVGNVILAGGTHKGMLLEAEYLPLPSMPSSDETSELLSNLLTAILPNVPDARTVAIAISDSQWEEALWNCDTDETAEDETVKGDKSLDDDEGIYAYEDEERDSDLKQRGDWVGPDRERRSAYLIIGALKSEGIL